MAIFEDYITLKEAASISGYHADYIGALVRSGAISGKKVGNKWMVSASAVRVHFSTKHYAPATRVFSLKKVLLTISIAICIVSGLVYVGSRPEASLQSSRTPTKVSNDEIKNGLSSGANTVPVVITGPSIGTSTRVIIQDP
ncbi:MAG: helix-turn-helix domain-containing protein [bacterium]